MTFDKISTFRKLSSYNCSFDKVVEQIKRIDNNAISDDLVFFFFFSRRWNKVEIPLIFTDYIDHLVYFLYTLFYIFHTLHGPFESPNRSPRRVIERE